MKIRSLDISLRALCLLPMFALGACDPKLNLGDLLEGEPPALDDEGSDEQMDSGEENDSAPPPESTTVDPPPEESDDPASCDQWTQDCAGANEKCVPYADDGGIVWDALKCVEIDPAPVPVGSPCLHSGSVADPIDNCEKGAICWEFDVDTNVGTCVAQCEGTEDAPTCGAGTSCVISNGGVLNLCLPDCDPLAQDCGPDQTCISANTSWFCAEDASEDEGQLFDVCEFLNACDPGFACVNSALAIECDPNRTACCLPLCDLSTSDPCPGSNQACVPWYAEGEAPSGKENVGLCSIPD